MDPVQAGSATEGAGMLTHSDLWVLDIGPRRHRWAFSRRHSISQRWMV